MAMKITSCLKQSFVSIARTMNTLSQLHSWTVIKPHVFLSQCRHIHAPSLTLSSRIFCQALLFEKHKLMFHKGLQTDATDALMKAKIRGIQKDILPLTTKKVVRRKKTKDSGVKNQEVYDVISFAVAEELNLESLHDEMDEQGLYEKLEMPGDITDALYMEAKYRVDDEPREILFFREGSVVFWNMPKVERDAVMRFITRHQQDSYDQQLVQEEFEDVEFSYTESVTRFERGAFYLQKGGKIQSEAQLLEKYAFSNALSLSVKLAIWEASLNRYVDSIEYILEDLKEGRKLRISRAGVLKKSGELLNLRHLINLSSDLLDTPDFYWDREELEMLYNLTCKHFNIARRVKIMNEKLSSCFELTELLRANLAESHSNFLEWLIIVLIGIEICFEVLHFVERYVWDVKDLSTSQDE